MKYRVHYPVFVVIVWLSFVGMGPQDFEPEAKSEVKLGATIPLSGPYASYGSLIRDGIELARIDLESAGYSVEVFYEDVPLPGPSAVTAIRKLATENRIHGLAANFLNPAIPVMAPIIKQYKILSFHTAEADDLILNSNEFIFTTNARIRDEASRAARHAFNSLGSRKAAIVFVATTFGDNYAEHFRREFESLGGAVVMYETTLIDQVDHRALVSRLKGQAPDLVFAAYFGTNFGVVLNQIREQGINVPILGVYETEDDSVLETAGANANGVQFFAPEPESNSWVREQFLTRFKNHFGYQPTVLASNAYDSTMILTRALSVCKLQRECAQKIIRQTSAYPGVSGTFSLGADGAANKEFVLKHVDQQSFKRR